MDTRVGTFAAHVVLSSVACYFIKRKYSAFSKVGAVGMFAVPLLQCKQEPHPPFSRKIFYGGTSFVILTFVFMELPCRVNLCVTFILGGSHAFIDHHVRPYFAYHNDPCYPQIKKALREKSTPLLLEQATVQKKGKREEAADKTLVYASLTATHCKDDSSFIQLASWYCRHDQLKEAEEMLQKAYFYQSLAPHPRDQDALHQVHVEVAKKTPSVDKRIQYLLALTHSAPEGQAKQLFQTIKELAQAHEDSAAKLQQIWEFQIETIQKSPIYSRPQALLALAKENPTRAIKALDLIDPGVEFIHPALMKEVREMKTAIELKDHLPI